MLCAGAKAAAIHNKGERRGCQHPSPAAGCGRWAASGDPTFQGAQRGALHAGTCSLLGRIPARRVAGGRGGSRALPRSAVVGGGRRRVATADAEEPEGVPARIVGVVVLPGAGGRCGEREGRAVELPLPTSAAGRRGVGQRRLLPREPATSSCGRPAGRPPWKNPWSGTRGVSEVSRHCRGRAARGEGGLLLPPGAVASAGAPARRWRPRFCWRVPPYPAVP